MGCHALLCELPHLYMVRAVLIQAKLYHGTHDGFPFIEVLAISINTRHPLLRERVKLCGDFRTLYRAECAIYVCHARTANAGMSERSNAIRAKYNRHKARIRCFIISPLCQLPALIICGIFVSEIRLSDGCAVLVTLQNGIALMQKPGGFIHDACGVCRINHL